MDLVTHRTGIVADWKCGMYRWWLLEHDGGGIVPPTANEHLRMGIEIHQDLADVAAGKGFDEILEGLEELAPPLSDQLALEPWSRRVGWITAWCEWIWPKILEEFERTLIEKELVLEWGDLWVVNTADLVLRHRKEGWLWLLDYKSVGLLGKEWVNHWPYAVQVHINIRAVEKELGEKVRYGQIIGLTKGKEDRGKLRHPYVWAYRSQDLKWSPDWHASWDLAPVASYPEGVVGWVRALGEDVGRAQFPFSAPIFPDDRLLDTLLARRLRREREVNRWREKCQRDPFLRGMIFEQRFEQCRPSFGSECEYLAACHNAVVNEDPLGSGLYVKRDPHHELEKMWLDLMKEV